MSRTQLIAEAEATALRCAEKTVLERAAWRAAYLSDPYSRPTFERAHKRADEDADRELDHLECLFHRLCVAGLAQFAGSLWSTTIKNCQVAIDLASFDLTNELKGRDARAATTLPPAPSRQAQEAHHLHRVPDTDRDGQARRAQLVRFAPAPPATEGGT